MASYDLGHVAKVLYIYDILIFGLYIIKKSFFVKIEVFGKNVQFSNISENTKENLINFPD